MPPSPRRSPKETFHKRGHSFGSILPAKAKDDELLLFTDMRKHDRDNFLLEPAEDFDYSISKFSYFRDLKIGSHIAIRGENHDFLNVGGDKNDYDWLLTPPETPLFRSLDDEEDHHIGLARRGRAPIKPILMSRSFTIENTRRPNRSSASPNRLSPSPHSCSTNLLTRTRSSNSPSRYSPPLALQPSIPSQRSSTPPASKRLTSPRRSPSPASRRTSTGSSDPMLIRKIENSLVKANRRSSSPRLQGWQSSDPGFSFEAPPNLCTSLSDRPVSRSRGGSPSSSSGLDMGWRGRRQSISPTPSRRVSSVHSNDRDHFSSHSKASATSSAEDDLDLMQSIPISYTSSPAVRKNLAMKTTMAASSKKPSKSFSLIYAPKRPFDSAFWLMDHHKAPQDMFRPLLSSVPSNTFSAGKGNDVQQPTISYNSSLIISNNTNSEHGDALGPCTNNEKEQHDAISECEVANISIRPDCPQCSFSSTRSGPESPGAVKSADSTRLDLGMETSIEAQASCNVTSTSDSEVERGKMAATCARCGKLNNGMNMDAEVDYCEQCALLDEDSFVDSRIKKLEEVHQQGANFTNPKPCMTSEASQIIPDCSKSIDDLSLNSQLVNDKPQGDCLQRCPSQSTVGTTDEMLSGQHVENFVENIWMSGPCSVSDCQQKEQTSVIECEILRDQSSNEHNKSMLKCTTGWDSSSASSSIDQGPSRQSDVHYYIQDNVSSKLTIGQGSSSAASSIGKEFSRQSDVLLEHLKSSNHYDFEKAPISSTVSCQSIASMSDIAISSCSVSLCPQSDAIVDPGFLTDKLESSISRTIICTEELDGSCKYNLLRASAAQAKVNDDSESFRDAAVQNQYTGGLAQEDNFSARLCSSDSLAQEDNFSARLCSSDTELHSNIPLPLSPEENAEKDTSATTQCYPIGTPEHANDECGSDNKLDNCSGSIISEEDVLVCGIEAITMQISSDDESPVKVEGSRKKTQQCFTLEEATDTIRFCSSIVHDIAYRAATIGLEHKQKSEVVSASHLKFTMVEKNTPKGDSSLKLPHRQISKHKKKIESGVITETDQMEVVAKDHVPVCLIPELSRTSDSMKRPKLKSKCNCEIM